MPNGMLKRVLLISAGNAVIFAAVLVSLLAGMGHGDYDPPVPLFERVRWGEAFKAFAMASWAVIPAAIVIIYNARTLHIENAGEEKSRRNKLRLMQLMLTMLFTGAALAAAYGVLYLIFN